MTETRRWLERERRALVRFVLGGRILGAAGVGLAALAAGVLGARLGVYRAVPLIAPVGWLLAALAVAGAWWWSRRRAATVDVVSLAARAEEAGGQRRGSITGTALWSEGVGSGSLAALADRRTAGWLEGEGRSALDPVRRSTRRWFVEGATAFVVGAGVFLGAGPFHGRTDVFWRPWSIVATLRAPVTVAVDRLRVRRGESVIVAVSAVGRSTAGLWTRAPGEAWRLEPLSLDSNGRAERRLGPLMSDLYLRATAGGRSSATLQVGVALPALFASLELVARYPDYLERPDEPLAAGSDTVALPAGTRILTSGSLTVPLSGAAWESPTGSVPLRVDGSGFRGVLTVDRSDHWRLAVRPAAGGPLDEPAPELTLMAIPDAAPVVAVPLPGADTVAPITLRQPLLIDVHDDYALTGVELVSWRARRVGGRDSALVDAIPLPPSASDRAVLHAILDLNGRGFLPGDTALFQVRAYDNAPARQRGSSRVFALRLPERAELRRELREDARTLTGEVDSLASMQRELARKIEELAAARERGGAGEQLPFDQVEQAAELAGRQGEVQERASEVREALRELSDAAVNAGLTDPEFQRQLDEIRELLDRALSPELAQRLEALRQSLERLDPAAVRDALEQLAEAARQLQEALEQQRELFERAALEGEMTSLAADADELARRQREWNESAAERTDSLMAAQEDQLAANADSLTADLERLSTQLDSAGAVEQSAGAVSQAGQEMRQAAQSARRGDQRGASRSGEQAAQSLDPVGEELRQQRDAMRDAWREEVLAAMDGALVETAQLARRQEEIGERLEQGETGADTRGAQAAVREGVDRVIQRLQGAAGRNALVSPELGATLGMSRVQMNEALDQLQRPNPSARQAGEAAGEALDALNAVIYSLLRSRSEVAGAQSGSGLAEALEQMAQLAEQQGAMNGETGSMLTIAPQAGALLSQQLRGVAERERSLAESLDRLQAEGQVSGAEALAEEARAIARELEQGRLDRGVTERQERLFRRLLDAGRTLQKDEPEESEERVSKSADPALVAPPVDAAIPPGLRPRFRYPTWEELRGLSPEARRLILDYFRRLNERGN